jgi:hypothetical protein
MSKKFYLIVILFLSPILGRSQNWERSLSKENWRVQKFSDNVWSKAYVPGTIHTDLFLNHYIQDPFLGNNEKQLQWIEEQYWVYQTKFIISKKEIQAQNQAERLKAASIAHQMIHDSLLTYHKKHKSQQAQHVICDFRAYMKNLAKQELQRAHQKLDAGQCQHQVLEELSERLIQKLIHYPTIGIQKAAIEDKYDILEFTNYLFNTSEV